MLEFVSNVSLKLWLYSCLYDTPEAIDRDGSWVAHDSTGDSLTSVLFKRQAATEDLKNEDWTENWLSSFSVQSSHKDSNIHLPSSQELFLLVDSL